MTPYFSALTMINISSSVLLLLDFLSNKVGKIYHQNKKNDKKKQTVNLSKNIEKIIKKRIFENKNIKINSLKKRNYNNKKI